MEPFKYYIYTSFRSSPYGDQKQENAWRFRAQTSKVALACDQWQEATFFLLCWCLSPSHLSFLPQPLSPRQQVTRGSGWNLPLRNWTPPDEQVTSLVAFLPLLHFSILPEIQRAVLSCCHSAFVRCWSYFVSCHDMGSEKHSNQNVKICKNTELLRTNQRKGNINIRQP